MIKTKQEESEKVNINVEVDKDLHNELRIEAIHRGIDFHNYIRTVLQDSLQKER